MAGGQDVRISVDAVPGADLQGKVRSVSGVASRQMFGGGTRQYDIAIEVAGDTSRIRPGVSAGLAIACQTYDDALHVPRSAVFEVSGKRSVYFSTPAGFEARENKVVALTESVAVIDGVEAGAEVALVNPNASADVTAPAAPGASL